MSGLVAADFPAYFRAVHGYDPFPWQARLAAQGLEDGRFPDVLAIPTGCGKTSALDVALFALAARPDVFPRRVLLVIDRRVVVDQGAEHAKKIRRKLMESSDRVAAAVLANLRALWAGPDTAEPFEVAVLRGGMPREDGWARRPDRPVLGVSTVDQVGSRLLFRGYGPSEMMASVHAGLLGHDTLFLLDEVHLSVPFAETLHALRSRWRSFYRTRLPDRWGVISMSATPGVVSTGIAPFTLSAGGEDDDDSRLRARLSARKPVTLKHVPVSGDDELLKRDAFARAVAGSAADLVGNGVTTVGVVVNRVATAQNVAALLRERSPKSRVFLITGRMRPLDRDALLENLRPHIEASRERDVSVAPLLVVATQCIEAGADFDFDALVTECASLDALKQRFGRLNRLGIRAQSPGVILARSDQTSASAKPDPVYGGALKATWEWLQARSRALDFGIRHLPDPTSQELETLIAPRQHAPVLLPTHVDAWSQTQLHPHPDPDVALWLHGPQRGEPEVQLVWRADCTAELMRTTEGAEVLKARLAACPPSVGEALSVPISAAQRWLAHMPIGDVADVPASAPEDEPRARAQMRPALWWRGEESRVLDQHYRLEPGMTLVVPTDYGGLAHGNWAPDGVQGLSEPIQDLGDLAQWLQRGRATLRLRLESLPTALRTVTEAFGLPRRSRDDEDQDLNGQVAAWVDAALRTELSAHWQTILAALASKPRIVEDEDGSLTLIARRSRMQSDPTSTEDDGASFTERATSLDEHSQHVWCWADGICHRLGLPEDIRRDIVLAAWLHDAGKADPRFQRWLAGGTEVRLAMLDQPLAKSAQTQRDRQAMNIARQRAGYPAGYRHELLSVAMVQSHPSLLDQASDRDLVLHLIGAHHGWCRPFAPFLDDEENLAVKVDLGLGPSSQRVELTAGTRHGLGRLDSGVADRFWTLTERYGWWGLAWLEAILRLSDHRASAHGAPDA